MIFITGIALGYRYKEFGIVLGHKIAKFGIYFSLSKSAGWLIYRKIKPNTSPGVGATRYLSGREYELKGTCLVQVEYTQVTQLGHRNRQM